MAGLDDPMAGQPVAVRCFARLVDEGNAVADERRALAALQSFVCDAQAEIGLSRPRGRHDELVLVSSPATFAQRLMRSLLKRSRGRKRRDVRSDGRGRNGHIFRK